MRDLLQALNSLQQRNFDRIYKVLIKEKGLQLIATLHKVLEILTKVIIYNL